MLRKDQSQTLPRRLFFYEAMPQPKPKTVPSDENIFLSFLLSKKSEESFYSGLNYFAHSRGRAEQRTQGEERPTRNY